MRLIVAVVLSLALMACQSAQDSKPVSTETSSGLTNAERTTSLIERGTVLLNDSIGKYILGIGAAAAVVLLLSKAGGGGDNKGGAPLAVTGNKLNTELRISTWFHACQLAPSSISTGDPNCYHIGDNHVNRWLDATAKSGANAVEIMVSGFIMDTNGNINHAWANRIARTIDAAAKRGIYVGVQVGNFWGKGPGNTTQTGHGQMLNWWTGPDAKIRKYINQVGQRFLTKPNTFAVFNEMDHDGLGGAFKAHARTYVDMIHQAAGRPVPVGISEGGAWINNPHVVKLVHNEAQMGPSGAWGYDEQAGASGRWDWDPSRAAEYDAANAKARQMGASIFSVSSWTPDKRGPIPQALIERWRRM